MGWVEEEREKRLQEKEQEKERALSESEKWKQKVKHIEEFWSDMLKANENLPDDFRLHVDNNKTMKGKTMKMIIDNDAICVFYHKDTWASLSIIYDTEKQRLVGKKHKVLYKVNKNSVDSLLRNLCTGQDIITDLKLDPSIIASSQKAIFIFILSDLIVSAMAAKSVGEFLGMFFLGFPLLRFYNL